MLSRTAENLFWIGRYVERAEATARLMEMGRRMAMLPGVDGQEEWRSVVEAAGAGASFGKEPTLDEAEVCRTLILDEENPSSIRNCLAHARNNARAVRIALTAEMWAALNEGWRTLDGAGAASVGRDLPGTLERIRTVSALFRGAAEATMLRSERYDFLTAGALLERADMTLRFLDVKHFVLLPETGFMLDSRDRYRWISLLQATSAVRAYHFAYRGDYNPSQITDFLLLNPDFPCSPAFCYAKLQAALERLAERYGARHACHETVALAVGRLANRDMEDIFDHGLHEFLTESIDMNARLSDELARAYHF